MPMYVDLKGVRGGTIQPAGNSFARSVSGFMEILKRERVCSGADDCGSTIVWIDDEGSYRVEFMRYRVTINAEIHRTKAAVRRWLKEWLPRMSEPGEPEPESDGEERT